MNVSISNVRRLQLLMQPYMTVEGVMEWYGKSRSYAEARIHEMHNMVVERGKKPVRGKVSRAIFMEYEGVTMEQLIRLAKIEKEILV